MPPANSNESYCTFTLASDVTAGGLPSEQEIAKDLESSDDNVSTSIIIIASSSATTTNTTYKRVILLTRSFACRYGYCANDPTELCLLFPY